MVLLVPAAQVLRSFRGIRAAQARPLAPAAQECHICSDSQAVSDGRNRRNVPAASDGRNRRDVPAVLDVGNRRNAPEASDVGNCRDAPEASDGRNCRDAPVVLEDCTCQDAYVSRVVLPDSVGAMIYIDQDNP